MSTADFTRHEGYEEGYTEGHRKASLDGFTEGHHRGFVAGLQAAHEMAKEAAKHEPFLGVYALDTFDATLQQRIQAGGCEPNTGGRWAQ